MEEENPIISMGRTRKITRRSIHTFLTHYQYFTSIASLIALPFSITLLVSQSIVVSRSLHSINPRLNSVFDAAKFPPFFSILCLKLSQSITSSILTFPFVISFLLLAKASTIHFLKTLFRKYPFNNNNNNNENSLKTSFSEVYSSLLSTQLWNSFLLFSANATSICTLFFVFTFLEGGPHLASPTWTLMLSAIGAVFYSIVLANALVISNLALVSTGMEGSRRGGFSDILRACALIKGKTSTALALAIPINLGLAAIEALFHFRIATRISGIHDGIILWVLSLEGLLIGYLYSILLVLDVIMSCFFYQSCRKGISKRFLSQEIDLDDYEVDEEDYYCCDNVEKLKGLEEFVCF